MISALPACRAPPVGLPCRVRGASPRPVFGGSCDPADESTIGPVRLLRSFAPPALPGFFATTTSADFSRALTLEISPSKVLHLSPRAARLYLMRLDGVRVSLLLASSPPAPGLTAGSCSCGRGFAFRFLQLHLAATPCGSARVGPITSLGIFHPLDTAHVGRTSGHRPDGHRPGGRDPPRHPPVPSGSGRGSLPRRSRQVLRVHQGPPLPVIQSRPAVLGKVECRLLPERISTVTSPGRRTAWKLIAENPQNADGVDWNSPPLFRRET